MNIPIEFNGLNVTNGEAGNCPTCDGPISEGEWAYFGVCTCCANGDPSPGSSEGASS